MPGWMLDPGWSLVHRQQPHPEDLTPPLAEDQQASQVHPEDLTPPLAEDQQASLGVMLAWHQVTLASRMVSQACQMVLTVRNPSGFACVQEEADQASCPTLLYLLV